MVRWSPSLKSEMLKVWNAETLKFKIMKCWNTEIMKCQNAEKLKCWYADKLICWSAKIIKIFNVDVGKCWNYKMMKELLEFPGNGFKWLETAGKGWNRPWFVLFWQLVINMTGFDDDDDGDSNGMAYIKFVKVSCYKKKKCLALMAWPGYFFDWTSSMFLLLQQTNIWYF